MHTLQLLITEKCSAILTPSAWPIFQCHAGKKAEASEAEPMDEASSAAAAANEWTTTVLVLP